MSPLQSKAVPRAQKQQQHHCLCPPPFASLHLTQISNKLYPLLKQLLMHRHKKKRQEEISLIFIHLHQEKKKKIKTNKPTKTQNLVQMITLRQLAASYSMTASTFLCSASTASTFLTKGPKESFLWFQHGKQLQEMHLQQRNVFT